MEFPNLYFFPSTAIIKTLLPTNLKQLSQFLQPSPLHSYRVRQGLLLTGTVKTKVALRSLERSNRAPLRGFEFFIYKLLDLH